jgi:cleavage and polyadenylation specificity factor subunit 1
MLRERFEQGISPELYRCDRHLGVSVSKSGDEINNCIETKYFHIIQKTSITTHSGLFEFPFMSFGLRNAALTFQRFMDDTLREIDFCFAYLDDILVISRCLEEHDQYLRTLIDRLQRYGILSTRRSASSKQPRSPSSVTKFPPRAPDRWKNEWPFFRTALLLRPPVSSVTSWAFLQAISTHGPAIQAPLEDALSGPRIKGSYPIVWTPELHKVFEECKPSLSRATLLAHPDPAAKLALVTDFSISAMGVVLQQRVNACQPLAFFFKKLSPAQQKYSAYDRELLAVYEAVKYFRHILKEHHFIIFTDHTPFIYAFQQKCSSRQFNHLDFVAQVTTDIRHISGQDNVVADALSRVEFVTVPPSHDAQSASQDSDDELGELLAANTALRLKKQQVAGTTVSIYCDTCAGKPRPYVPAPLRLQVFQSVHDLSHPGTKVTAKLVAQRFVWPRT